MSVTVVGTNDFHGRLLPDRDIPGAAKYLERFASRRPLAPDFAQRAVGVDWPEDAPASYSTGDVVSVDLSSLAMTGPGDVQDQRLQLRFAGKRIGVTPVDNTVGTAPFDENGTASVDVTLPRYAGNPDAITFVGRRTGTRLTLPIDTRAQEKAAAQMRLERRPQRVVRDQTRLRITVRVASADEPAFGRVLVRAGGRDHVDKLSDRGRTTVRVGPFRQVGKKVVRVRLPRGRRHNGRQRPAEAARPSPLTTEGWSPHRLHPSSVYDPSCTLVP